MRPHKKSGAPFLSTLLCLISVIALTACGGGGSGTTKGSAKPARAPLSQQIFRTPDAISDINTFDPAQATDLYSIGAIDMVFTGLVTENDQLQVVDQLAASHQVSPDGLTYTFTLRPNLKFSDGTPLTSQDVAYSIDRALSPDLYNNVGISLTYLGLIKGATERANNKIKTVIGTGIQIPNANTVVIHVIKPTAYFLQALSYTTSYVVEKTVIDKWGPKWTDHLNDNGGQGGDGPFMVQKYNHSTGITLVPNPNYYGPQPILHQVAIPFVSDDKTNYLQYQAGQVDETSIPTADNAQAQALTNQFYQVPQLAINFYGLNYLVKPLDNIHIRQALELAINKDVIVQRVLQGQAIATNHIIPKGMQGYNPNLTGPDGTTSTKGNTAKAQQLFQQGLQEEHMTLAQFPALKFSYSNKHKANADEVTTVIQMWHDVLGITSIKPAPLDSATFFTDVSGTLGNTSMQIWKSDWYADYPDPQDWITLQFDKGLADNVQNYGQNHSTDAPTQQALQAQMEQADTISNPTDRIKAYNTIEQQLVNEVAWLPMQQVVSTFLIKPYVVGVVNNAENLTPPNDWGSIYIAQH